MKIVIDIPEEVYKCCLTYKDDIVISNNCNYLPEMTYSIVNGIPLPKGHGKLIDADELLKAIDTWDKFGVDDTGHLFRLDNLSLPHYVPYTHYDDMVESISGAETIIEAEKTAINHEKTTITDGDLISRDNAIKLVNYALAENKDVLEVLENMPSAEK